MFIGEALKFSVEALRANKVRTFLTSLGLVIGNASVILVVTISITGRDYVLDQIRAIGSNIIYGGYQAGSNAQATADADFVKLSDVNAVRQQLGGRIVAATGVMTYYDSMLIEGKEKDIKIIGSDEQYSAVRNLQLLAGRFMDQDDVAAPPEGGSADREARPAPLRQPAQRHRPDHPDSSVAVHRYRHLQGAYGELRPLGAFQPKPS